MSMMHKTIFTELENGTQFLFDREFSAPLEMVWRAWTEAELLDRWWSPLPWKCVTQDMEFKAGGRRFYCMIGPDGEKHWAITSFIKITDQTSFDADDAFCDEKENIDPVLPQASWHASFSKTDTGTRVKATYSFDSHATMRQWVDMGAEEGSSMAFNNLDELLAELDT